MHTCNLALGILRKGHCHKFKINLCYIEYQISQGHIERPSFKKKKILVTLDQALLSIVVILTLRKVRQRNYQEFKTSLGYVVRPHIREKGGGKLKSYICLYIQCNSIKLQ